MKLEYEKTDDERVCVAFVDVDDDLWVFVGGSWRCMSAYYDDDLISEIEAKQKFYSGDKITITF